jgi:uncharacterized protein YeaO (DUF488 family)
MKIQTKRVYDPADSKDGFRILVDRLWPRGLSKESANIDLWLKSVAPSNDLRKWYNHDPDKWLDFKKRYFSELDSNRDAVNQLLSYARRGKVSFLFSSKEPNYNNAAALKEYIESIPR